VVNGRAAWEENKTIKNAINIDQGVVVKDHILKFQNRYTEYPHEFIAV
jgi:N5-(carboxyethyl)ornithine synthase